MITVLKGQASSAEVVGGETCTDAAGQCKAGLGMP